MALGNYSHAEGYDSIASDTYSHAEGYTTVASGSASHAEGYYTKALKYCSHSEGNYTIANGSYSHAEGYYTVANGEGSHVSGEYNVEDSYANWREWVSGTSYAVGDKVKRTTGSGASQSVNGYICKTANSDTSFTGSKWTYAGKMNFAEIIGNGTGASARSNARALDWDGNEYLKGDLYVGCNADSTGGTKVAKISDIPSYSDFTGATAQADGVHGFVPAPLIADKDKFLKGDGTWSNCFINGYSVSGNVLTFY